jgi:hypothetical protein
MAWSFGLPGRWREWRRLRFESGRPGNAIKRRPLILLPRADEAAHHEKFIAVDLADACGINAPHLDRAADPEPRSLDGCVHHAIGK